MQRWAAIRLQLFVQLKFETVFVVAVVTVNAQRTSELLQRNIAILVLVREFVAQFFLARGVVFVEELWSEAEGVGDRC